MERQHGFNNYVGENSILSEKRILANLLIKGANKTAQVNKVAVDLTVPLPRKRHATESAMLSDTSATSTAESKDRNGADRRQINITKVVDKFLLEFMQALSDDSEDPVHIPGASLDKCQVSDVNNTEHINVLAADTDSQNISLQPCYGGTLGIECITKSEHPSDIDETSSTSNKKSKQSYRPSRPPLLPPCRICSDKASGYHYGVNTCEACKGFFRRSICKTGPYVCTGSGNCSTFGGKRTLCSYCRFKRCLEVGMSKDAIKTGRYTHELRSKNILEVKNLERLYGELDGSETLTEQRSRETDMLYAAFQTDYLKNKVLDEMLQALINGQKFLYEFLDDYYNEELMKERQLAVYVSYINKTKASKNLESSYKHHNHSDMARADGQSNSTEAADTVHSGYTYSADVVHSGYTATADTVHSGNKETTDTAYSEYKETTDTVHSGYTYSADVVHSGYTATADTVHSGNKETTDTVYSVYKETTDTVHSGYTSTTDTVHSGYTDSADVVHSGYTATADTVHSGDTTDIFENHSNMPLNSSSSHSSTHMSAGLTTQEVPTPAGERVKAEVMAKIITNMEQSVQGMLIFAKALPRFDNLPKDDQASLLKAGRFDVWYIGHIRCFNVDLRVGACEWQFHANELAQVWGDDMINLAFTLSRVGQSLKMTKEETAALRAVCLTFPDRCMDLVERNEVEKIHQEMLDVLKHTACKRMSSNAYHKWFCKVIDFLMLLREFGVKFEAISTNIKLDWSVLKGNPLLLSVFLS